MRHSSIWAVEQRAYYDHKCRAKRRGIGFHLSFKEWVLWWGLDYSKRGRCGGELCMARHGDTGAYELGNISKLTMRQNISDAQLGRPKGRRTREED